MTHIYDFGLVCSLGISKKEVVLSLFSASPNEMTLQEKEMYSGNKISEVSLHSDFDKYCANFSPTNTRCENLLNVALDQISDSINNIKKFIPPNRIGVVIGSSVSGMLDGENAYIHFAKTNEWPIGFDYSTQEISKPSDYVSIKLDISGPSFTVSTACSSGAKAFISAKRLLDSNICDAVIVGGVDTTSDLVRNGFDSLELLAENICDPFSNKRSNITLGEGAALFILTRTPHALSTIDSMEKLEKTNLEKQEVYISLTGFGESSDAYHMNAPDPTGDGAKIAIQEALKQANLTPDQISYVNLHGTGTILNDKMEANAISAVFSNPAPCSSTKNVTGHTLGAAGALEVGIVCLIMMHRINNNIQLPEHHIKDSFDDTLPFINIVTKENNLIPSSPHIHMMTNSFAFGGSNVSLILSSFHLPVKDFLNNNQSEFNE